MVLNDIFFSIIVPCYNVQEFLAQCIESILGQTYENFELLLIDDGSTDATSEICDQFGEKDKRIHVYHQQNAGNSVARNYGMDHANGDYFVFVDSDDFITEDALNNFNDCIRKTYPEVLITRLIDYYEEGDAEELDQEMDSFFSGGVTSENALIWEMTKTGSAWSTVKKIVSKNFIDTYSLRFPEGFLHEDMYWNSRIMMHAEIFDVSFEYWYYHRRQRKGSITNTVSAKRITDVIQLADQLINSEEMKSISEKRRELITSRIMCSVYPILSYYKQLTDEEKGIVIKCCRDYKDLFRITPKLKYRIFSLAERALGFRFALKLIGAFGDLV